MIGEINNEGPISKEVRPDSKNRRQGRHEQISEKIFSLYVMGVPVSQICKVCMISPSTFHDMKKRNKWKAQRKIINKLIYDQTVNKVTKARKVSIENTLKMITLIEEDLLKKLQDGNYPVRLEDHLKAVRALQTLTLDSQSEGRFKELMKAQEPVDLRSDILEEIAHELTPVERAAVLQVNSLIKKKKAESEKEILGGI